MEQFMSNNSIYIVLAIVVVILAGLGIYMFGLDKKISKIEKSMEE